MLDAKQITEIDYSLTEDLQDLLDNTTECSDWNYIAMRALLYVEQRLVQRLPMDGVTEAIQNIHSGWDTQVEPEKEIDCDV